QPGNRTLVFRLTANGISVEPSMMEVSVGEGQTVNMSCTYTTDFTDVVMYWYRQYPGEPPLYTRRHDYDGDTFSAEFAKQRFIKGSASCSLEINELEVQDIATYYCRARFDANRCAVGKRENTKDGTGTAVIVTKSK
uniref:Ig-like domain-containing protein n=1 Tax=Callorhinchus milii TaxID=7868 RepID=A0A4W3GJH3_CALMI